MAQREKAQREKRLEATILFADMVDASLLSHVLSPRDYDAVVSEFQEMATEVLETALEEVRRNRRFNGKAHIEAAVRGDEIVSITAVADPLDDVRRDFALLALQMAIRLKRRWLVTPRNEARIEQGQPPLGIAIGIHSGPVIVSRHARIKGGAIRPEQGRANFRNENTAEGYAINLAKRVETASRAGRFSRIFVTRPIFNAMPVDFRQAFVRVDPPSFKGVPTPPLVYEAKGIGHFDDQHFTHADELHKNQETYEAVARDNPNEIWLLLDLAHMYFDRGEYDSAATKYKEVLEIDPAFPPAYTYLGRSYFRAHRLKEALSALEKAVELDPRNPRACNFLAVCLRRIALHAISRRREKAHEEAKEALERALLLHEQAQRLADIDSLYFPWAENAHNCTRAELLVLLYEMNLLSAEDSKRDLSEVRKRAESLLEKRSEDPKRHVFEHSMGIVLLKLGLEEEARRMLKTALSGCERREEVDTKGRAEHLAEILFHLGLCDKTKAREHWRRARRTLEEAWSQTEQDRKEKRKEKVLEAQYWWNYPLVRKSDKTMSESLSEEHAIEEPSPKRTSNIESRRPGHHEPTARLAALSRRR